MCHVGLLVTEPHRTDETLVLDRPSREVGAHEGRLGHHALPTLLVRLLASMHNLEHLLLGNTLDLGQGHGEPSSLLGSLVLDGGTQSLSGCGVVSVEQVGGDGVCRLLVGGGGFDVALLVGLDLFAHLDLLLVPLLGVHLGAQTAEVLSLLRGVMTLTGGLLACTLFMIETTTMKLCVPFHVLILRHDELRCPREGLDYLLVGFGVEMRASSYESSLSNGTDTNGRVTAAYDKEGHNRGYDQAYRDEPPSPTYMPEVEAEVEDVPFMNEEDRRKYEMAHSWQLGGSSMTAQPRQFQHQQHQHQHLPHAPQGRMYGFSSPGVVRLREEGYAETLPGTPVNAPGGGGTTPTRGEFGGLTEGYRGSGGGSGSGSGGGDDDERQGLMVPSTADGGGSSGGRRGRGRSPLARETFLRVPFEDDDELVESQQEDERP